MRTLSAAALPAEVVARIAAKTAIGRLGAPEEVASVAAFLLSHEASFVTGSVHEINGGQTQTERTSPEE
ncbi:MAG TPA: SDR family oxidoreductase [Caulobacteraceae bacterium]|nr:SDR family oxidoreductase [Caulobacteraceae bacterium]